MRAFTPINDQKVNPKLQVAIDRVIRTKPPYKRIDNFLAKPYFQETIDIFVCAQSAKSYLSAVTLDSVKHAIKTIKNALVVCSLEELEQCIMQNPKSYCMLVQPGIIFKQEVDIQYCTKLLRVTGAQRWAFCCDVASFKEKNISIDYLKDAVWFCQLTAQATAKGPTAHIYRTAAVLKKIQALKQQGNTQLEELCAVLANCSQQIELFFAQAPATVLDKIETSKYL